MKRFTMYGLAVAAWLAVGHYVRTGMAYPDDGKVRTLLVASLGVAICLTVVSALLVMLPPRAAVYHAGLEAGMRRSGCKMYRPSLMVVAGGEAHDPTGAPWHTNN